MNTQKMLELADVLDKVEPKKFHMSSWFGKLIPAVEHDAYYELEEWFEEDDLIPTHLSQKEVPAEEIISANNDVVSLTCGTTACLAGWAIANEFYLGNKSHYENYMNHDSDAQYEACKILGLSDEQAKRLFYCGYESIWEAVSDDYDLSFDTENPETWNIHPKHAADVLRRIVSGELSLNQCNCATCREE